MISMDFYTIMVIFILLFWSESENNQCSNASIYLMPVELGIVRSIDTLKGLLYVITPVPQGTLENVDLLLQGFIQIPTSLLQVIEPI